MYADIDKRAEIELDGLVKSALGPDWQARAAKLLKDALEQLTYDVTDYIASELVDRLRERVNDAARRTAEAFLTALAEGNENQIRQFLQLPSTYSKQRDEHRLGSIYWERDIGPMALRRKMIEVVQARLESEVILDQEAEIQALRAALQKAETELVAWRGGERVCHARSVP